MAEKQKIIIDTDVGWDDVMSILLMMKDHRVEIAGITVTGCGETHLPDGMDIARRLLALADNKAPVCAGADHPSQYDHVFPEDFRKTMDDVMGLRDQLPPPCTPLDTRSAVQLIGDILSESCDPVIIISLGGLTNIAAFLETATQKQLANIRLISIMGGAVGVPGNVADLNDAKPEWNQGPIYASNKVAEWNIFIDALAAQKVFRSTTPALPIALVALNACNDVILDPDYADMIIATDPVAKFLKEVIIQKTGTHAEPDPVPVFDPLATTYGVGLLQQVKILDLEIDVLDTDTEVGNTCGWTVIVNDGSVPVKQVAMQASDKEFREVFAKLANTPPTC